MTIPHVSIIVPIYNRVDDLQCLLESIFDSTYTDYEVLIIDNCSTEDIETIVLKYKKINNQVYYYRMKRNMMAAGGRNEGIKYAKGELLCFIDSDNIIRPNMLEELVRTIENDEKIGMVGPLMVYHKLPTKIWFAGNDINLITSRTTYWNKDKSVNEIIEQKSFETDHIPNLMMVRKSIAEQINGFDESYYIMYEEADFAWRIKKAGWRIVVCPKAITEHNCFIPDEIVDNEMRKLGCDNPERTFHFSKNRNVFIRKYAPWYGKILYFSIFRFIFAFYYCTTALKNKRLDIAIAWLKGVFK